MPKRSSTQAGLSHKRNVFKKFIQSARRRRSMVSPYLTSRSTTLGRAVNPFPIVKRCQMEYISSLQVMTSGAAFVTVVTAPNSMFDYDKSTQFGNKQPNFYDALLSATGPYRSYKVISWVTTFHFVNTTGVPVTCFVSPPVTASSEADLLSEVETLPGVATLALTPPGGCKDAGTITVRGHIRDVYPSYLTDNTLSAAFGADPSSLIIQTFSVGSANQTTTITGYIAVKHVFNCELSQLDATIS